MKESTKTAGFVVSAVAMLSAAIFTGYANQPRANDDYETVGQPFYENFKATNQAKSLVVTSIDPDAVVEQRFEIKQIDGLWQIPSHEGYPAEAAERLAKTAASLIGLTRDSLVGRRTSDYEKFGVVDPRNDDLVDIESVGQSITLHDANEDVLVDLIIGDRADEDPDNQFSDQDDQRQSYYYVRRADETNVYRIPLKIELSTKFSDWIEPDLLQLDATDVSALDLNNYQIEERSSGMFGQVKELLKVQGDQIALTRSSSTEDWELQGLNAELESLRQSAVQDIVAVLDEMVIVDVKKKPTLNGKILLDADLNYSLTPSQAQLMSISSQAELDALSVDQQTEFQALQMGVMELQRDLEDKGFSFGSTGQALELVSAGGEMQAGTSEGLRYTLHIGKAPTDTNEEIKVAGASDEDAAPQAPDSDHDKTDEDVDGSKDGDAVDGDDGAKDEADAGPDEGKRYVLIRVSFDDSLLDDPGEEPTPPAAPVKPDGYTEAVDAGGAGSEEPNEGESENSDDAPKPKDMERNPDFVKYDQDLADYETAKVDHEVALSDYQTAVEEKNSLAQLGKQKAKLLNGRFEKWYYIVSSENLKTLRASRTDLIEPATPATTGQDEGIEALENRPDLSFPEIDPPSNRQNAESESSDDQQVEKPAVTIPDEGPDDPTPSEEVGSKKTTKPIGESASEEETQAKPAVGETEDVADDTTASSGDDASDSNDGDVDTDE